MCKVCRNDDCMQLIRWHWTEQNQNQNKRCAHNHHQPYFCFSHITKSLAQCTQWREKLTTVQVVISHTFNLLNYKIRSLQNWHQKLIIRKLNTHPNLCLSHNICPSLGFYGGALLRKVDVKQNFKTIIYINPLSICTLHFFKQQLSPRLNSMTRLFHLSGRNTHFTDKITVGLCMSMDGLTILTSFLFRVKYFLELSFILWLFVHTLVCMKIWHQFALTYAQTSLRSF